MIIIVVYKMRSDYEHAMKEMKLRCVKNIQYFSLFNIDAFSTTPHFNKTEENRTKPIHLVFGKAYTIVLNKRQVSQQYGCTARISPEVSQIEIEK